MSYLADANVLSEPTRKRPDETVVQWLREHERELVVDPIILGEIRYGILRLRAGRRRRRLEEWFAAGAQRIHCLPWDTPTGLRWSELLATLHRRGRSIPIKDSMIAATALQNGLTVVTRNRRDFEATGAVVLDPFEPE